MTTPVAPLAAWYAWAYLALFLAVIVVVRVWAAVMDRRRGRAIEHDLQRPGHDRHPGR